jgi:hypothetical protein
MQLELSNEEPRCCLALISYIIEIKYDTISSISLSIYLRLIAPLQGEPKRKPSRIPAALADNTGQRPEERSTRPLARSANPRRPINSPKSLESRNPKPEQKYHKKLHPPRPQQQKSADSASGHPNSERKKERKKEKERKGKE